jgi:alpha-1,3-mannosyltransferase
VHKWQALSPADPRHKIISFGRFATHKRIGALFALLRSLRARDASWTLTVVGSPAGVSPESLREAASDLGDAVAIVVRPTDEELSGLISDASYFACASSYEGFGIAAVEAMSAGLVPLLSDIPPFRKLLRRSDCGITIDLENFDDTAARLEAFEVRNRSGWNDVRRRLMMTASLYEWERVADEHTSFYQSVMEH